jgi:hypothetical protein
VTNNPCTGQVEQSGQLYFRPCNNITRAQAAKLVAISLVYSCPPATPR